MLRNSGTGTWLKGIGCSDASTCDAVGDSGTVLRSTNGGASWAGQTSGVSVTLYQAACPSTADCEAAGLNGTIVGTANGGATWATQTSGTSNTLYGLACPSATACFAAGINGTILATTNGGATWTAQSSGTTMYFFGIACASASACVAVGGNGTIRATSNGGSTWTAQTSGVGVSLRAVACPSASVCYAVGDGGTVVGTSNGGSTWAPQASGTTTNLHGLACSAAGTCDAVGDGGLIIGTTNGGSTWAAQASGTARTLLGVACASGGACYAAGDGGTIQATVPSITTSAGFDPDGNLVGQTQTIGSQVHSFSATLNPADWPQQATNDALTSGTVGDGGGDVLSQTIQNQAGTVNYNIDQTGRQNEIGVTAMGSTTPLTTTLNFNNNEQLTGALLPNNVEQDATYDAANRLSGLTAVNNANHSLLNTTYQYGYDPLGLTSAITTTVQGSPTVQTLTHDAAGRLTAVSGGASTGSWSYDGRANLTSATINGVTRSYTYSSSNPEEVTSTSVSGQPTSYYGYDGNGDTTSITTTGTLNQRLSYDAQSRLVQVTLGSPITSTIAMAYNAFGQRAAYTVTQNSQTTLAESFKYQGDQLAQVAYTGTSITTPYTDTYVYTQDGAPLELLRQRQGASTATPYWYVLDGQRNVVALTDQSGNVVDSYSYDQWGVPTSVSEQVPQQLRYAGYWYDNELGWYWLSVRAYDPGLERFLQPDPSELEGLFNYVYAGDSPSDLVDASGLAATLQSGCLLTTNGNFECNVAVGSAQWNYEVSHGAKVYSGVKGTWKVNGFGDWPPTNAKPSRSRTLKSGRYRVYVGMHPLSTLRGLIGPFGSHAYILVTNGTDLFIFEGDNPPNRGLRSHISYYNRQQDPTAYSQVWQEVAREQQWPKNPTTNESEGYWISGLENQRADWKGNGYRFVQSFQRESTIIDNAGIPYNFQGDESDTINQPGDIGYNSNNFA